MDQHNRDANSEELILEAQTNEDISDKPYPQSEYLRSTQTAATHNINASKSLRKKKRPHNHMLSTFEEEKSLSVEPNSLKHLSSLTTPVLKQCDSTPPNDKFEVANDLD